MIQYGGLLEGNGLEARFWKTWMCPTNRELTGLVNTWEFVGTDRRRESHLPVAQQRN